jgi:taurine dioxygenase
MEVTPVTAVIGAEVRGVDLASDLDDVTVDRLRGALNEHHVLFFREQSMTPAQQLAFAERFGPVQLPMIDAPGTDVPGVTVLDQVGPKGQGTDRWHADSTFMACPPLGAILQAVKAPKVGGDTCFASMVSAYESLSPSVRALVDGLEAVHSTAIVNRLMANLAGIVHREGDDTETVHPVVRVHPESGRRVLFVNGNFTIRIVGMTEGESRVLLDLLFEHVRSSEHQVRFRWETGSVAFWDNRAVQHFAVPDYDERRVMHRVMITGDAPVGVR